MSDDSVEVVAGIIRSGDRFLITKRPEEKHLGGYWEFPGGKLKAGENPEDALRRELKEELQVSSVVHDREHETTYHYDDRTVHIRFYSCTISEDAQPRPAECEQLQWVTAGDLTTYPFPPADRELLERLQERAQNQ